MVKRESHNLVFPGFGLGIGSRQELKNAFVFVFPRCKQCRVAATENNKTPVHMPGMMRSRQTPRNSPAAAPSRRPVICSMAGGICAVASIRAYQVDLVRGRSVGRGLN